MPIGDLSDLIDLYLASEGMQELRVAIHSGDYIPDLR